MSSIGGKKRETVQLPEFTKKVGLFEATVVAISPTVEEFKNILGIELKDDSKAAEYLSKTDEGNDKLRVDVWMEEVKTKERFKASFYLEDKEKESKDGLRKQYINAVGACSWANDPNDLLEWFKARDYRVAYNGEEELYSFLRVWLGGLDYRDADTTLQLDWKKLMKGNLKDLKAQINGEFCKSFIAMATIKTSQRLDEETGNMVTKEFQNVYSKAGAFMPAYCMRQFKLMDYSKKALIKQLSDKQFKDLAVHEKFVVGIYGQYGCKDYFVMKQLEDYNPENNMAASDKVISTDGSDF